MSKVQITTIQHDSIDPVRYGSARDRLLFLREFARILIQECGLPLEEDICTKNPSTTTYGEAYLFLRDSITKARVLRLHIDSSSTRYLNIAPCTKTGGYVYTYMNTSLGGSDGTSSASYSDNFMWVYLKFIKNVSAFFFSITTSKNTGSIRGALCDLRKLNEEDTSIHYGICYVVAKDYETYYYNSLPDIHELATYSVSPKMLRPDIQKGYLSLTPFYYQGSQLYAKYLYFCNRFTTAQQEIAVETDVGTYIIFAAGSYEAYNLPGYLYCNLCGDITSAPDVPITI